MKNERTLSIFVDESGSFDSSVVSSRFYLVSFVLHDQQNDIAPNICEISNQLSLLGFPDICIHVGPLIRHEEEFRRMDVHIRRQLFFRLLAFTLHAPIFSHTVSIDKRYCSSPAAMDRKLRTQMGEFLVTNESRLAAYDSIKVYYDNGQPQVQRMLKESFADLPVEFVNGVLPSRYRLFQVADLVCSAELLKLKMSNGIPLTKSESYFFSSLRTLKKNVLRPLERIRL